MTNIHDIAGGLIPVWEKEYKVRSDTIDISGKLKFYCLCGYFFEIASQHANHLHFGYKDLEKANNYWVLSRLHVKMSEYPGLDQKIKLETWHKGVYKLFGLRDFRILDIRGKVLALATSAWLVLDKSSGRPVRPYNFKELLSTKADHHAIIELPDRIDPLDNYDDTKIITPGYTDLDINYHVNAGMYIAWIQDLYSPEIYNKHQISEFQINYMSETKYEDKIVILFGHEPSEEGFISRIEGRNDETNNPAFRALIKWTRK
jgi:medium-chain acyl-[acyl-carrier-protein] hydrolase